MSRLSMYIVGIDIAKRFHEATIHKHLEQLKSLESSVAAFNDPAISVFYQKKRSEGKIFAVLRDNKSYVPASTT